MSETEWESGEEEIDESGRNPTQRQIDEGDGEGPTEPSPHEGEEGQDVV